jgi:hypothetical protein
VEVGAVHWLVSLLVESAVFGLAPLTIILLVWSIHGVFISVWFTRAALAFGCFWAFVAGTRAALGIARWLEAISGHTQ